MIDVAIIERLTGVGVAVGVALAIGAPVGIFFTVFRRLRRATSRCSAGSIPGKPGAPGDDWSATGDPDRRPNSPLWWEVGDSLAGLVKPDPPDWVQRNDP